jgi:hypothetical protein
MAFCRARPVYSVVMKPWLFSALNHLTVPFAIEYSPRFTPGRAVNTHIFRSQ